MKRNIIISTTIGLLIAIVTSFFKFGFYDTEIGAYYSTGFPFKVYQMFGDAGIQNNYAFFGNFIIWSAAVFVIIFVVGKLKK